MTGASRVALVTGSSRGIGRATALRLAGEGYSVIINYRQGARDADILVDSIKNAGGRALAVRADINRASDVDRLFAVAKENFARVDAVVVNAATSLYRPHTAIDLADFDRVFELNARGAFYVLKQAALHIADQGRIVLLSSGVTAMPQAGAGVYAASKAAGEQMAIALARELGSRGVTVNVVSPGVTRTDGLVLDAASVDRLTAMTPLGRLGEPEDIAAVVSFLTGPDGRWVNGQNIRVNGGLV